MGAAAGWLCTLTLLIRAMHVIIALNPDYNGDGEVCGFISGHMAPPVALGGIRHRATPGKSQQQHATEAHLPARGQGGWGCSVVASGSCGCCPGPCVALTGSS